VTVRGGPKLAATLVERVEDVFLYRDLTTLRKDADLKESLADLEWKGADKQAFLELCDELGFDDVRSRPHTWR
jgi:5'-3' exonuclease